MNANKGVVFNKENFSKIQNNLKNEMNNINMQNEFIDFIHKKTSEVKINISTLKEVAKNESDIKVKNSRIFRFNYKGVCGSLSIAVHSFALIGIT